MRPMEKEAPLPDKVAVEMSTTPLGSPSYNFSSLLSDERKESGSSREGVDGSNRSIITTFANEESGKMDTIKLWSISRPHMRAFHLAWIGFCTVRSKRGGPYANQSR